MSGDSTGTLSRRSTPPPSRDGCPIARCSSGSNRAWPPSGREGRCESPISDRFESEGVAFQERIAAAFERIAAAEPERIVAVDAAGSVAAVHARIIEALGL